jgi:hypothetical protein
MFLSLKKLRPLLWRTTDASTYSMFAGGTVTTVPRTLNRA